MNGAGCRNPRCHGGWQRVMGLPACRMGCVLTGLLRGLLPAFGGMTLGACSMGDDPRLTTPQEGRALEGRVAVVYSQRYGIRLGGLERLHPFDIHKYDRIYEKLRDEELLTKEDVYVPGPLSDVQIRTVQSAAFL